MRKNHKPVNAIVYCEGAFNTTNGKTAHGLVRLSKRYTIQAVIDSRHAGKDAGEILDGRKAHIPLLSSLSDALNYLKEKDITPLYFIIGLAPDGGKMSRKTREAVKCALEAGLHVVSGLHDFVSDDPSCLALAEKKGLEITDIRKPPSSKTLHFFTGKIETVSSVRILVLGTDSAVGKRTSAWMISEGLNEKGISSELIGTGQTAWLQGARYGVVMDALVNDFVAGEIEHAILRAEKEQKPDVMVLEGQGSLMNPAYPGGFELIAAGRPHIVILQHAPERKEYDGFPGYPIEPLAQQIALVEQLSRREVFAITLNHEGIKRKELPAYIKAMERTLKIPVYDILTNGTESLLDILIPEIETLKRKDKG